MKRYGFMILVAAVAASPAWANSESREKQMLRRMQQQVQQIEQARTQAEQEKATALADKESLGRELDQAKAAGRKLGGERAARGRAERELKATRGEVEALKLKLADTEARLALSDKNLKTSQQALAQTESAKKQAESQLSATREDRGRCVKHNGKLYSLSREVMTKYRDKTCQDALAQAEPFTGMKRVEVENLLEIWRDRGEADRLDDASPLTKSVQGTAP